MIDNTVDTPDLAYICDDFNHISRVETKNVRKIYWGLRNGIWKNVSDAFYNIMGSQWRGDDSLHKCAKHQEGTYIPGSCDNTMCYIMSPVPTKWFGISSTWMMTDDSYYIHQRLNFKKYIRDIVDVNAFKPTKVLCVRTGIVVPGTECDTYFAVSHVWSSSNFMMVDGRLSRASKGYPWLERMSKQLGIGYAWMDICCIDQDNADEKRREVPRMGDYYRNSHACAVLHSADIKDIDDFISSMRILSTDSKLFIRPAHTWALACIRYSKLLEDVWFTRIWTTQEALLNKRLVIDSSRGLVDLKELLRCYNIIVRQVGGIAMSDNTSTVWMLSEFVGENKINMMGILKLCANRQAKFKHDYVYGIMGMLPHIRMDVDYTIPVKQVVSQLCRLLIERDDMSWLSWIGFSCMGRRKESWIPVIGSSVMFPEWDNQIPFRHGHSLMDVFCRDIKVKILGGSTSHKMYKTEFQPIVTLCNMSRDTGECAGCIARIFCEFRCCRPWMIMEAAEKMGQIYVICDSCRAQKPDSDSYILCMKHISEIFHTTLGSCLWLAISRTDNAHMLIMAWKHDISKVSSTEITWTEKYLLYGERVKTITKYMDAKVLIHGNFGWLTSNTMERIGFVVRCSKKYAIADEYISV